MVVGDTEYYYGHGIHATRAGRSPAGHPDRVVELGATALTTEVVDSYLVALSEGRFAANNYNLLRNNCNNFANEFSRFLTGQGLPDDVLKLPDEVLATPYGQTLLSFLANFETAAATHDAEDAQPAREAPRNQAPRRGGCGPPPAACGFGMPMFMMMGGPCGGAYGCPPCRPRRSACRQEDKPSTSQAPAEERPEPPPAAEQHDPVGACLADLVDALRSAGRPDLLDNVLAEHHGVLASLRGDGDEDMPEAPKKASDDSFEVVQ